MKKYMIEMLLRVRDKELGSPLSELVFAQYWCDVNVANVQVKTACSLDLTACMHELLYFQVLILVYYCHMY